MIKFGMKVFAICALTFFMCTSFAICDNFQYDPHGRRDPFVPLMGVEKQGFGRVEDISSIEDVHLEGVAIGANGKRVAIINGEMLKENSKVGDFEVKKVEKKSVTVSIAGKIYDLVLPEEGGVKSE